MEPKLVGKTLDFHGAVVLLTNSHRLILISGMEEVEEDIMDMDKDMKTIAILQLPKTLTCSTVAMLGMGTTSNQHHSSHRSNKEDICR